MKVLHVQDVDFRTTAPTLVDALKQVRGWSVSHPRHVPMMILLELKEDAEAVLPTKPLRSTSGLWRTWRRRSFRFSRRRDNHSGGDPRLVRHPGRGRPETRMAPPRRRARGRVMFALDNEDRIRDLYLEMHSALCGQLCFVSVAESHPTSSLVQDQRPGG